MTRGWIVYWSILISLTVLGTLLWAPAGAIEAFAKLLGAVSPMVTVGLAIFGLFVWRMQLVAKRRFELAEEALVAVFSVVYALESIRGPFSWAGEGGSRKAGPNETPKQKEDLDHAFVPWERMATHADKFTALEKSALLIETHFGEEVPKQMRVLLIARARIGNASNMMRRLSGIGSLGEGTQKTYDKAHAVLYASGARDPDTPSIDDVLTEDIEMAKGAIVTALRPHIAPPRLGSILAGG
jgi:hypothetical protein